MIKPIILAVAVACARAVAADVEPIPAPPPPEGPVVLLASHALDGNPLEDLSAVRRVVFVMRGGIVYKWTGSARP